VEKFSGQIWTRSNSGLTALNSKIRKYIRLTALCAVGLSLLFCVLFIVLGIESLDYEGVRFNLSSVQIVVDIIMAAIYFMAVVSICYLVANKLSDHLANKITSPLLRLNFSQMDNSIELENAKQQFPEISEILDRISDEYVSRLELSSNIAHEFKTPLATIKNNLYAAGLTAEQYHDAELNKFITNSSTEVNYLSNLIVKLLELSHLDEKRYDYKIEKSQTKALIQEIIDLQLDKYQNNECEIIVNVQDAEIETDVTLFSNVVRNLLDNALKYAKKRIIITSEIRTIDGADTYCFEINNDGKIIEEKNLTRIFERFYRTENFNTRTAEGKGIGLSIVKKSVEALSGKISVVSDEATGTEFRVELPVKFSRQVAA
jgi:two-component system phosphate regulon sensor histidine kinase PhoR